MKFLRKHDNDENTRLLVEVVKDEGDHDKYKLVYWVSQKSAIAG